MRFVIDYRLSRFENGMTKPYRSSFNVTDNRPLFLDHPVKPDDDMNANRMMTQELMAVLVIIQLAVVLLALLVLSVIEVSCMSKGLDNPENMTKSYYVYILASKRNGTLYIGITSNLIKRVWEHKEKNIKGFTKKYNVSKLVYFEQCNDPENAIKREKRLKRYNRKWKLELIEKENPNWRDLYYDLIPGLPDQVGQ
jgi:putative endonuclease